MNFGFAGLEPAIVYSARSGKSAERSAKHRVPSHFARTALLAITSTFAIAAGSAHAQVAGADGTAEQSGPIIEEIVVTADRTTTSTQRTPLAVSAITGDQLAKAGIVSPAELSKLVPALEVTQVGGSNTNFYLRGVGTQGANAFAENAVAFNVDGVFVARPGSINGYFYDLERVEVVKGPQGTLYGRNATGGAINVITKRPTFDRVGGNLTVGYGNYNNITASGALNVPIGGDLAFRVAGQVVDRDGYYSNGYDDEKTRAVRGTLLYMPSDGFSALVAADYVSIGGKGPGSSLVPDARVPLAPPLDDRVSGAEPASLAALQAAFPTQYNTVFLPPQDNGYVRGEFKGVRAEIEAATPLGRLTLLPAYKKSTIKSLSFRPGFYNSQQQDSEQLSFEARLASQDRARLGYILGIFYFDGSQNDPATNLLGPQTGQHVAFSLNTKSYAAFGQLSYAVTDALKFIGGARYTKEDKSFSGSVAPATLANLTPTGPLLGGSKTFRNVSWKAGVQYDLSPRSMVYGSVTTGFKAGGFFASASNNTFAPERLTAYVLGSKNRFLNGRLQANAEVFYWDYKNQQIQHISAVEGVAGSGVYRNSGITENVGQASIYGTELDVQYLLSVNDRLGFDIQYLHNSYDSFRYRTWTRTGSQPVVGCPFTQSAIVTTDGSKFWDVNCSGKPGVNSPRWSATVSYQHIFDLPSDYNLALAVGSKLQSSRFLNIDYLPQQRQGGFTSSNLSLTLNAPDKRWSLAAWVNNIEDNTVKTFAIIHPVTSVVYSGLAAPRTYGARLEYSF